MIVVEEIIHASCHCGLQLVIAVQSIMGTVVGQIVYNILVMVCEVL